MSIAEQITALTTDKTAIETAIANKGGTLSQNSGFDTFAVDIASIPNGSAYDIDDLIDGSITSVESNITTTIRDYVFRTCGSLQTASFPLATRVGNNAFQQCTALVNVSIPLVTRINDGGFSTCSSLTNVYFPKVERLDLNAFVSCSNLTSVCFPSLNAIYQTVFSNNSRLVKIILGYTNSVVTLSNVNAFNGTPFATTSTVTPKPIAYVPSGLINSYQDNTNWSALNCEFKAIATTTFSGDGITATFTLTNNNVHPDEVFYIKIGNNFPEFTYNNTTGVITFTTAPASGTDNIVVYYKGVETV